MKLLSRDFNTAEKVLLTFLTLLLLGLAYYWFVDQPCRNAITAANSERDALQVELFAVQAKEAQLKRMQDELDRLGSLEETSRMESYNNTKAELTMLNNALTSADSYYINFSSVTRNGDQIRRNFSLQFTTRSFDDAKSIIADLSQSEYRCLLGDMQYSVTPHYSYSIYSGLPDEAYDVITVNTTATFYETMYDGTPDAGLPADEALKAG